MQCTGPVCASCGARFAIDDFTEDLGELVTCPYCGGVEIELEPPVEQPANGEGEAQTPSTRAA